MKILQYILSISWLLLTLWILTYGMYISFVYSLAMLWCFWPSEAKKGIKRWIILGISPLIMWNVGLVEYGRTTIDLHCRVLGYFGSKQENFCSYMPEAYNIGKAHKEGPLFSTREHLGVHGFNFLLATGGVFAGLPEVAWETLYLSFASDPTKEGMVNQSKEIRKNQCKGGAKAQKKDTSRGDGNWMFSAKKIRQMVAQKIPQAKEAKEGTPKKFSPQEVEFKTTGSHGNSDNKYYGELMRTDNLRVPITLVVPDGILHLEAQKTDSDTIIDVLWTGSITYPPNAQFTFPIPTIYSLSGIRNLTGMSTNFPLLLSEGIFCGMLIDGSMNAYTQEWHTTISVDDERLSKEGQLQSQKGWIEFILSFVF